MAGGCARLKGPIPMACSREGEHLPDKTRNSRVLVVGSEAPPPLLSPSSAPTFASSSVVATGAAMVATLGRNSELSQVDINNVNSLEAALSDVDLVVHAAGPFQQADKCSVLEAAINNKTAYIDVCDDTSYASRAKSLSDRAVAANIPAITTGGIYPGVSNVMAAELVRKARSESKGEPERLRFYCYTAGTGGVGPTILATSFLLLGEEVVAYNKGEKIKLKPYSGMLNIDFGRGIGKRRLSVESA